MAEARPPTDQRPRFSRTLPELTTREPRLVRPRQLGPEASRRPQNLTTNPRTHRGTSQPRFDNELQALEETLHKTERDIAKLERERERTLIEAEIAELKLSYVNELERLEGAREQNEPLNKTRVRFDPSFESEPDTLPDTFRHRCPEGEGLDETEIDETLSQSDLSESWIDRLDFVPHRASTPLRGESSHSCCTGFSPSYGLPKFEIGVFSGDPLEWPEWSLSFKNLIHDNPSLTESQKLGYLKTFLGEEPRSKVFGLLLNERNYSKALRELQERYGNPVIVIDSYVRKVRDLPKMKDISDLSEFSTHVSQLVQMFTSMGYQSDLKGLGLLSDLVSKIPENMKESWGNFIVKHGRKKPTVELFQLWLIRKGEALRLAGGLKPKKATSATGSSKLPHSRQSTLATCDSTESSTAKCYFCGSNHVLTKCESFLRKSPTDKLAWFRSQGRCFLCFRKGHRSGSCGSQRRCRKDGCTGKHAALLHEAIVLLRANRDSRSPLTSNLNPNAPAYSSSPATDPSVSRSTVGTAKSGNVHLQTLPVRVHAPNGRILETYALIDCGSQISLIQESFARELGLKGPKSQLSIGNIRSDEPRRTASRVSFWLSDPGEPSSTPVRVNDAWTFGSAFNLPSQRVPRDSNGQIAWPHVKDLSICDVDASQIMILIGADTRRAMVQLEVRMGPENLPMAVRTPLGWTVMGAAKSETASETTSENLGCNMIRLVDDSLESQVANFWSTESFGCSHSDRVPLSIEDRRSQAMLDSSLRKVEGHYEVCMLWRETPAKLINNYVMAKQRFDYLCRKLNRDPIRRDRYKEQIESYLCNGYARRLSPEEAESISDCTYYLPHHGVVNPRKPEKLRVVFDAAATFAGHSLNDKLMTGPDLTNSLIGVLMRFRQGEIAMAADIKAMFHQVRLPETDSDALRFLWKDNLLSSDPPHICKMLRHVFGSKSSPCCSSYCLKRTALDNELSYSSEAVATVLNDFYVDDLFKAVHTSVDSAVALALELIRLVGEGGFKLTSWISNSPELLAAVSHEKGIETRLKLDSASTVTRALGAACDMKLDAFVVDLLRVDCPHTKRGILSAVSSVFDPIGFLAPYVIRAKILLQTLWEKQLGWDDPIGPTEMQVWSDWCQELEQLQTFRLDRCYWPKVGFEPMTFVLHVFCDSSERSFGAVGYLQTVSTDGQLNNTIVLAKTRVAPAGNHRLTIPRLELQAAVLAVRLYRTIVEELTLNISAVHLWSDSSIVLHYIRNDARRFKTFVANRVAEIRAQTTPDQWHHVPSALNPADDCTRGLNACDIKPNHRWLRGPEFLWSSENEWPGQDVLTHDVDLGEETKKVSTVVSCPGLLDVSDYSQLPRLQRVVAWVRRFCHNLRCPNERKSGRLSIAEHNDALLSLVKVAQHEVFHSEIDSLQNEKSLAKNNAIVPLTPILKDGVLRVGGRLDNARLPYDARHQILLPKGHALTDLIVKNAHEQVLHAGPEHTIAHLRRRYWIPAIRVVVKGVIRNCLLCHRKRVQPKVPVMAQLPLARLSDMKPIFYQTGLDYFGPLIVKRGRKQEKRWVCLFTCLTVRAIHLELVMSLQTDSFILAFRRFVTRRGSPHDLYSDNGTNFVGAQRELKEAVLRLNESDQLYAILATKQIQWHFIPPRAPHMGGAWERLVRTVKTALRSVLGSQCVHEDTLNTVLCEVEYVVNSRPLTSVSTDPSDLEVLTPNHFLFNSTRQTLPIDETDAADISSRKRWRQSQVLADHFWRRWRQEYLPRLAPSPKWRAEVPAVQMNDIVLIVDKNAPRGQWPLARVLEVFPGKDNRVRVVKVKTALGIFTRPVTQIAVLESDADVVPAEHQGGGVVGDN